PIRSRGLISALLTLAALGGTGARAQESVRLSQNLPGDAKPVVLTADEIYAWGEGKQRVFLLRGQALVEHGVLHARFQQGVVWVDTEQYQSTRVWHVDLYMDGEVRVTNGSKEQAGANGLLDLHTRGELKVKGKVKQEAQDQDPLYRQALAERRSKNAT